LDRKRRLPQNTRLRKKAPPFTISINKRRTTEEFMKEGGLSRPSSKKERGNNPSRERGGQEKATKKGKSWRKGMDSLVALSNERKEI